MFDRFTSLPTGVTAPPTSLYVNNIDIIFFSSPARDLLNHLATHISSLNSSSFSFYTDGSLQHLGSPSLSLGLDWILISNDGSVVNPSFYASTFLSPSSTKAEIMAILSAIIVCPTGSTIKIHTDSQAAIDGFELNVNDNVWLTDRRRLKNRNHILWSVIKQIIYDNDLKVFLRKVKAHSGDPFND